MDKEVDVKPSRAISVRPVPANLARLRFGIRQECVLHCFAMLCLAQSLAATSSGRTKPSLTLPGKKLFYGQQGGFQHKSSKLHHDEIILAVTQQVSDHCSSGPGCHEQDTADGAGGLSHLTGIYLERVPLNGGDMAIAKISGHVGASDSVLQNHMTMHMSGREDLLWISWYFSHYPSSVHHRESLVQTRRERFAMRACLLGYPVGPWQLDADERRAYMDHGPTRYVLLVEQDRRDAYLGNSLAFLTSKGNIIEFRGMQASRSRRFVAPPDRQICGLGFTGSWLTRVTTCPLEAHETDEQNLREHIVHPD
ncbi:NEK1 [Symbiodinium natans]|uniref:NEK1 protein n=1 Tax=Symbiodinium natans TaxID=878477 RepID=A0A812R2H3_9DINO|nr:NEK1 [Symbiodinium natans]